MGVCYLSVSCAGTGTHVQDQRPTEQGNSIQTARPCSQEWSGGGSLKADPGAEAQSYLSFMWSDGSSAPTHTELSFPLSSVPTLPIASFPVPKKKLQSKSGINSNTFAKWITIWESFQAKASPLHPSQNTELSRKYIPGTVTAVGPWRGIIYHWHCLEPPVHGDDKKQTTF